MVKTQRTRPKNCQVNSALPVLEQGRAGGAPDLHQRHAQDEPGAAPQLCRRRRDRLSDDDDKRQAGVDRCQCQVTAHAADTAGSEVNYGTAVQPANGMLYFVLSTG